MGTLSKRPLSDFGHDIKERIEGFRSNVGHKIDDIGRSSRLEGRLGKRLDKMTSSLPSSTWLVCAGGALVGSLALRIAKRPVMADFVAQWVPTFLVLGLYNRQKLPRPRVPR